ncbi:MAG: IS1634 family transposase [Bacteroidales bacterium]|nr:IS1634 family transposase [Bacteroidales bacterium]
MLTSSERLQLPRIYPKKIKNQTYYYYQYSYRVKIDSSSVGNRKGSGKSKVCTKSFFLGTASSIFEKLNKTKKPIEITYKEYGLIAAAYQVAHQIGLVDALKKYIPGQRYGIPRWIFFFIVILNRLDCATSKEQIGKWVSKTILPQMLDFDPKILNSKTYWYVTDDVISEKELKEKRRKNPDLEECLCVGLDTKIFEGIEDEIWPHLHKLLGKTIDGLIYDTTNFFTYIEEPVSSWLAKTGHNKESRHHLKQVGLAMVVEKDWGIPLFHRLYRGNSHDSKTFHGVITEILQKIKYSFSQVEDLVLVLDKGNNSKDNFTKLKGNINWVGSLSPSKYKKFIKKDLSEYNQHFEKNRYYRTTSEIMGVKCVVIVTHNDKLYRKQEYSLKAGINKFKKKVQDKFNSYKRIPKLIPKGIESIKNADRYGLYVSLSVKEKKIIFTEFEEKIEEKRLFFGKHIIFSDKLNAESPWIINRYKKKEIIEDDFKILKNPDIIRFRPVRHWTDTKIYAFGFCCIMSLILIKVIQIQADRIGLKMSPIVLKEELKDMKEIIMIYSKDCAERDVSKRSSVQQKLWDLFELMNLKNMVNHTQLV